MVRLVQLEAHIVLNFIVTMTTSGLPVVQIHTCKPNQITNTIAAIVPEYTVIINVCLRCMTAVMVLFSLTANVPPMTLCLQKVFLYHPGATVQLVQIVAGTENV